MLFKREHIEAIKLGNKTETRRRISRYKKGPKTGKVVPGQKIGSTQPCKARMFGPTLAYIYITGIRYERLGDIDPTSAMDEGHYTPEEYIDGVINMYDNKIDANEVMRVLRFFYVGNKKK